MKTAATIVLALMFLGTSAGATPVISQEVLGPSPWLAKDAFGAWLHANLQNKPFYIISAEGRLHDGISEWRVRWRPAPQQVEWYWYWWFDSTGPEYAGHVAPLVGQKGFDQIWEQSFVDAQGVRKYQSIYLRIVWPGGMPPVNGVVAPDAPAGPTAGPGQSGSPDSSLMNEPQQSGN